MSKTHWRKILPTAYLGGFDLDDGQGKFNDIVVTIKSVGPEKVKDQSGNDETCLVAHFIESVKPMILNVTNSKTLEKLLKSKYVEDWSGKRIQIGTEKVKAFGEVHDALRIRKFPPKTDSKPPAPIVSCTDCGETVKPAGGATVEQILAGTKKTYGAELCVDCAGKRKEAGAVND